jgi:hypothetical protein
MDYTTTAAKPNVSDASPSTAPAASFVKPPAPPPVSLQQGYITYVCISTPNLDKLKRNFELILPHVDRAVIVIGRRDAAAEEFLKSYDNVTAIFRPWDDSFRDQYQAGLSVIEGGWMLWLDDDEVPSLEMLKSLRPLIEQSKNATMFDTVAFRCCDAWDGKIGEPCDYYREMLMAWNNQMRFEIKLHQALLGKRRGVQCNAVYHHFKTQEGSMRGSCRNFFAAGVWSDAKESFEYWHGETGEDPRINQGTPLIPQPQGQAYPLQDGFRIDSWHEMKDILAKNHPEVTYFHQLDPLICNGKVCREFVEWAERHSEENDKRPHLHELHKFDMYIKSARGKKEEKSD